MRTILKTERGIALGMALGALVIIGVIVAGAIWAGTLDYRIATNTVRETGAEATAELGLNRLLATWQTSYNGQLKAGDTLQRGYTTPGGGSVQVTATRLPGPFFWITAAGSTGAQTNASARRRYGVLWRLNTPDVNFMGAITTQGSIKVTGSVTVNGVDQTPAGWSACTGAKDVAGAAISPTTTYSINGAAQVLGNPPLLVTPAAADSNTYFNYGGTNYQGLVARANLTLPGGSTYTGIGPSVSGGVCNTAVTTNWGDPNRAVPTPGPCESYFPIIHVTGNLKVTTGTGQGILLVDGNLSAAGNFTFYGMVIARGSITSTGGGNHFTGGVMAAGVTASDASMIAGSSGIQYSSCALTQVLQSSSYPKQAMQRGWVDLY